MNNNEKLYIPSEAAKTLGVSRRVLAYMRKTGRIEGTNVGNMYLYSESQIRNADLSKDRPGPGSKSKKNQTAQSSSGKQSALAHAS